MNSKLVSFRAFRNAELPNRDWRERHPKITRQTKDITENWFRSVYFPHAPSQPNTRIHKSSSFCNFGPERPIPPAHSALQSQILAFELPHLSSEKIKRIVNKIDAKWLICKRLQWNVYCADTPHLLIVCSN